MDSHALGEDTAVIDSSSKGEGDTKIAIATIGGMNVVSSTSTLENAASSASDAAAATFLASHASDVPQLAAAPEAKGITKFID